MKRLLYGLLGILLIINVRFVKAESFVEGKFISGQYVNKVKNGVINYATMQFIRDNNGNIVYCLEPYVLFNEGDDYTKYEWDLSSYNKLSEEDRRKIELIAYYGYGYTGRSTNRWYVITQVLIWKTVDKEGDIYFTDTLNGSRITKYEKEMQDILNDVKNHDILPNIERNYEVNYNDNLVINRLTEEYEIVTNPFKGYYDENLVLENIINDGTIEYKKKSNFYEDKIALFVSDKNQDLLRPGNVNNKLYKINIKVTKGDITLDIRDDNSYYSVESSLKDTCYELYQEDNVISKVCTDDKELVYKTEELPYGEYNIRQVSHGIGYVSDSNIYKVSINKENNHPVVILNNKLLKNTINIVKYECIDDDCILENGARFDVYDINNKKIDTLTTDKEGRDAITIGYGTYVIKQIKGKENYTFSADVKDKIVDEESEHVHYLYNYAEIKPEVQSVSVEGEEVPDELPPDTGIKIDKIWAKIKKVLGMLAVIGQNLLFWRIML